MTQSLTLLLNAADTAKVWDNNDLATLHHPPMRDDYFNAASGRRLVDATKIVAGTIYVLWLDDPPSPTNSYGYAISLVDVLSSEVTYTPYDSLTSQTVNNTAGTPVQLWTAVWDNYTNQGDGQLVEFDRFTPPSTIGGPPNIATVDVEVDIVASRP
jgi:hypothetical protein